MSVRQPATRDVEYDHSRVLTWLQDWMSSSTGDEEQLDGAPANHHYATISSLGHRSVRSEPRDYVDPAYGAILSSPAPVILARRRRPKTRPEPAPRVVRQSAKSSVQSCAGGDGSFVRRPQEIEKCVHGEREREREIRRRQGGGRRTF